MPSLHELQRAFSAALLEADRPPSWLPGSRSPQGSDGLAIYRRAVFANYRRALGATYPVVRKLVGVAFFNAAVDAYVQVHPSTSGDLNVYGDAFGRFLAQYGPASGLPYLPDVACLEWAMDETGRAPDDGASPEATLAALAAVAPERLPALRLLLAAATRLVASPYPLLRIWQANQENAPADVRVCWTDGGDTLLVRRDDTGVSLERISAGEHAWLGELARGSALATAIDAAQRVDASFDLGTSLRLRIADSTIVGIGPD